MFSNYSVSFDVELDQLIEETDNSTNGKIRKLPLITCAATYSAIHGAKIFYSKDSEGKILPLMSDEDCKALLDDLWYHYQNGATIISWGGTAVDFCALYSGLKNDFRRKKICLEIIKNHVDVTIASSTDIGIMMGLDAAAKGTGQGEKSNFISASAPNLWKTKDYKTVLEHVKHDALLTLKVYEFIVKNEPPSLTWKTRKGKLKTWYCSYLNQGGWDNNASYYRLHTVIECLIKPVAIVPFEVLPGMDRDKAVEWLVREDKGVENLINFAKFAKKFYN
jgi:hypothetical protein